MPSNSGLSYYLVILDDFYHFTWTFPLRRKSDVTSTLHSFYAYVHTHFHRTIAHLQTDNGKEFDNLAIRHLLSTQGTVFRLTCPYKDLNACPVCGALRYKIRRDDPGDVDGEPPRKRVPAKVMWYAPIIPRLKRLFQNKEHAKAMRWHAEDRKKDRKLRVPADGSQWRKIERKY